jgi:hypothetical protein
MCVACSHIFSLPHSAVLRELTFSVMQGGISPKALEHVIQSAHLNVQHASYSLMPAVTIFQGSIYDRLGAYTYVSGAKTVACLRARGLHRRILPSFKRI